jgi:hypothetical protein
MLAGLLAAAAAPLAQPRLAAFNPFLNRSWSAQVTTTVTDTHCFSRVYGGQHIRDVHQVEGGGRTVYSGETLYSVEGSDLTFTYWNSLGGVGRGKMVQQGMLLSFRGSMKVAPTKPPRAFTTTWRWLGADSYQVHDGTSALVTFKLLRKTG